LKKSKKIMLVVPSHEGSVGEQVTHEFFQNAAVKYMPLGVLSIAACLKDRHDVVVLDSSSKGYSIEQTLVEIEKESPDILGISAVTYRAWQVKELLKRAKCKIKVVGGPHATYYFNQLLEQGADAVFTGDAEKSFPKWIEEGCPKGVIRGGIVNLDSIPFPARDLVDLNDYKIQPNEDLLFDVGELRLPLFSSKGCPFKCNYCDVQQKKFNWKPPAMVVEEFRQIIDLGASSIHILDDCFNVRRNRVVEICELLQRAKVDVDWSVRAAVERREDVIKSLSEAGCKRIHVGIEHMDDDILAYYKKSHRYKDIVTFTELCSKYGIMALGYFIIGAPGESEEYLKKLPDMIKELGIAYPFFNILAPLNDTTYYAELLKSGVIEKDYWRGFINNPTKCFAMPSGNTPERDRMLKDYVEHYIEVFYPKSVANIPIEEVAS